MRLDTFFEARDLYDKYQLCEKVMEYLSDKESVKGQKYLETLKQFTDAFRMEFMMFVHERMESVGMQFEDCGKCTCENCPADEEPAPPTEDKEPKFPIGSKVEIVEGVFTGHVGTVMEYEPEVEQMTYYVKSDFNDNGTLFSMWFAESDLKAYVEESEDTKGFAIGDRVKVVLSTDENYERIGTVEDVEQEFIVIVLDGEDYNDRLWFYPEDLELYTDPENPEENDAD